MKKDLPLLIGKSCNLLRSQPLVSRSSELRLAKDVKLSACWEATHLYVIFAFIFYFVLVLAFIFTFIFALCFDVFCYFFISFLGTKEKGTQKEEIQLQSNSKNEEKNATDANSR